MTIKITNKETGVTTTATASSITYNEAGSVTINDTTYLLSLYDIYIGRELFFKIFGMKGV